MRIRIKLIATYRDLLPPENKGTIDLDVEEGTNAASILSDLGVPLEESVILVDGRSPEPGDFLEEGSVVFAFHATTGG